MKPKFRAALRAAQRIRTAHNKRRAVLFWCRKAKEALGK